MNNNQEITYTRKVMCRSTSGVNVWGFIEAPPDSTLAGHTVPCLIDKYATEELARFDHPDIEGFVYDFPDARAGIITAARSIKFNHFPLFELVSAVVIIAGVLALLFVAGCSDAEGGEPRVTVCDASVLPDSPGVNPQVTIMALSLRLADHLRAREG